MPWDTFKGSAEMLRNATVRPGEPPRPSRGRPWKDRSPAQARTTTTTKRETTQDEPMLGSSDDHLRRPTTDEQDVIEQDMVIDTEASRVSDDRKEQGVLRMDEEEGVTADEQARRRLRSKQPARRSLTDDESSFEATETRGNDCGDQRRDPQDCSRREAGCGTGAQNFMRASGQQGVRSLLRLRAWKISKWRERCC